MTRYEPNALVTKVISDITIRRQFEVCCNEHGVIDQPTTYAEAVKVRREHFFDHPAHRGADT